MFSVRGVVCVYPDISKEVTKDVAIPVIRCAVLRSERVIVVDYSGPPVSRDERPVAAADDG